MSEQRQQATTSMTLGELRSALDAIDWRSGLTRDQIRRKYRQLPHSIYLRLPSSKRFRSTEDVLHDAEIAASRAEGEYLGANPDLPESESVDEGGPPAWGPDPIFTPGIAVDGGSAEDRPPEEQSD
jgi:hypothetical protein